MDDYYEHYLAVSKPESPGLRVRERLRIMKIRLIKGAPSFSVISMDCHGTLVDTKDVVFKKLEKGVTEVELDERYEVVTDFRLQFYKTKMLSKKERVMSFWLHTQFLEGYEHTLHKHEIDKTNKKKKKEDFTLTIYFESSPNQKYLSTFPYKN